jgi:HAD superfamily hydrolase (TIGR01509 family)
MLQALIFDVDGTLADTEEVHLAAFNHAFAQEGLGWHWSVEQYTKLLGISGGKERMRHFWQCQNPDVTELEAGALSAMLDRLHEIKTAWYEAAVNAGAVSLRPGVLALMTEARAQGLHLAIATTTSPVNVAALLRNAMGSDWRSQFLALGDASTAPLKKPHPQVYLQVLRDMGLTARACVAFEDSANGLKAARSAGLATVITPNSFTAHHRIEGALRVVPDLTQVRLSHLREWLSTARSRLTAAPA